MAPMKPPGVTKNAGWALLVTLLTLVGCVRPKAPSPLMVAAGGSHTCLLQTTGAVWCWGDGARGQLGDGGNKASSTPVLVKGLEGVRQISAGDAHTCAIQNDNHVVCWGEGSSGQLGTGTEEGSPAPVPVTGLEEGVRQISAGWHHTCAVTQSGRAVCWGRNSQGQLGRGGGMQSNVPIPVMGLGQGVKSIVAGGAHSCAVQKDGGVMCWGYGDFGQLGNGEKGNSDHPVTVTGLSGVQGLSTGWGHTCAVKTDGAVVCWGYGGGGRLGAGNNKDSAAPHPVLLLGTGVKNITSGWAHNCALMDDGGVMCWGGGGAGRLGTGDVLGKRVPVMVTSLKGGQKTISAGFKHTCAAQANDQVFCWGLGAGGRLGQADLEQSLVPVRVNGLSP